MLPLTKISRQNAEKKIAKISLFKMLSKNSILDDITLRSRTATNSKINIL